MNLKVLSIVGFVMAVAGIVGLLMIEALLGTGPVSIAVQVLAVLLMIWARVTFGWRSFHAGANPTAGGLVTHGPFRWWRHPIYAAILYFVWAGVAVHFSMRAVVLALVITTGLAIRMVCEERLLVQAFPGYPEYAARTRRVIPFVV